MAKKVRYIRVIFEAGFEIADGQITWVGGSTHWQDKNGKRIVKPKGMPSEQNLLTHMVGKMIHGKNGKDELAITDRIE